MSTGMKKPPVAPKPRLLPPQKSAPPPIAPKPEISPPTPSPSVGKRGKPAVAPKPCLPKISPKAQQKPPPCLSQSPGLARQNKTQSLTLSKNGGPSIPSLRLSRYIIPPCSEDHRIRNGKSRCSEDRNEPEDKHMLKDEESSPEKVICHITKEVQTHSPSDVPEEKHTPVQVHTISTAWVQNQDQPVEQSQSVASHMQSSNNNSVHADISVPAAPSKPLPVPQPRRPPRTLLLRQNVVEDSPPETPTQSPEDASSPEVPENILASSSTLSDTTLDSSHNKENIENEENPSQCINFTDSTHSLGSTHSTDSSHRSNGNSVLHQEPIYPSDPLITEPLFCKVSVSAAAVEEREEEEEELQPPAPPPRQKSLHQKGNFTSCSLDNLTLSDHADPCNTDDVKISNDQEVDDDGNDNDEEEEGAYGNFARYSLTRSLPKQIRLGCGPRVTTITKAASAEEQSPKVVPKKPQRHSLPASAVLRKQNTPPQTQTPAPTPAPPPEPAPAIFGELPAPPTEKSSLWRITFPGIPLFIKQQPNRSSSQPQASGTRPFLVKQRAKSFSSADLLRVGSPASSEAAEQLVRSEQKRRSLRKLLELRTCVKLLPKLLRSGQSLDCTSTSIESDDCTNTSAISSKVTSADDEGSLDDGDGDCGVEYENVPLYEEIPEYMNLPWVYSHQNEDTGVYEVQEPYESHRSQMGGDLSEEEQGLSSNEEDDNSSTSSKDEMDQVKNKEEVERAKRNKVVHIAMEIMSSEKVFVDVLKLLHIDFRDAVAKATRASGKPVLEERVLNQILYYLPQLYELNKDLLRELEERVAHWSDHQRLADIFVQKGPYLKMYSTYIREFDRNVALLDEQCRKNPAFATVVRQFETSPRCASLALKHYLLKPVQRIPQYQLLLTDYLKNLPEDSSDYKDTQTALGVVKEVANHANDIMKQGDNFQKLMQVQYSLNGHHEIVQPGRVFLKEGTLMKLSRKVMQPRMFFLFNDILLYTTPVQSGQYKVNSMLSLAGMKVSKPSLEAYQNELNIESVERSFILSASSATERDEWLEAIATAIEDYTRKKISFISSRSQESEGLSVDGPPLGSKAPIWIPDLRTTMCMICTCEFTLTWRRHHCRACGKVVCQACSSNKYYLEYLKNQLARVCDQCYAKLQQKDKGDQSEVCVSPSGRSSGSAFSFSRKQKKIPSALKEVSANTENSSMSGYLHRSKGNKKPWKRLWFVIKNKVLYTYAASEDVAALESQPLLGFFLREEKSGPAQKLQFKLYHKNTLYYIFRADDIPTAQRWIEAFQEAMIL
ncbi:FYVE, RhoGEF and PH domain-containing protein 6 [Astyanax mexicanus]|uniref:FYVE, RhoGEF and PH domain-containing protein 6 n=1 Tax=Astyanax mexicanus TaxID=7994 RepID=UPI0020CB083F|nr:FYVE, RhoGEF and PH domain-containing protein 6 [Astyanax mexicanus]